MILMIMMMMMVVVMMIVIGDSDDGDDEKFTYSFTRTTFIAMSGFMLFSKYHNHFHHHCHSTYTFNLTAVPVADNKHTSP